MADRYPSSVSPFPSSLFPLLIQNRQSKIQNLHIYDFRFWIPNHKSQLEDHPVITASIQNRQSKIQNREADSYLFRQRVTRLGERLMQIKTSKALPPCCEACRSSMAEATQRQEIRMVPLYFKGLTPRRRLRLWTVATRPWARKD